MNERALSPLDLDTHAALTPAAARLLFPGTLSQTYFDIAGRSLIAAPVRAALDAHLDMRTTGGDKVAMFALIERTRALYAELIGAAADEVAYTKNISEGLNMIATAIDWQPGENVVLCADLEHANNVYVWLNLRQRFGVEVRALPMRGGVYPVAEMVAAIDARTRLVTACTTSFAPGLRTELAPLAAASRAHGALFLLDGAQSVGMQVTDVDALGADALAVSTQKGLLSLYGMGFLYVRRAWAERLAPMYLARFGVDLGEKGEAALGDFDFRLMPGARRFDLGNYNFLCAAATEASMQLLNRVGMATVEAHNIGLAERLAQGLAELGLPVIGAPTGPHRAQIVMVGAIGDGHDAADDTRMQSLHDHFAANKVKLSIRRGALRFSIHVYNDRDDVDRVLALAGDWVRTTGRAATGV
ncbi:MAG: aminotransferase class V-fold PLP-dependent enzyme [Proteobacteria bacterium]|nr:aminotransferase class V-fold PLP-dependent enzyme [Burkholderiales bacterium]